MNDATRELGTSLGVAVLGSLLSSRYASHLHRLTAGLTPAARGKATASLAGAVRVASSLPANAARTLTVGAQNAFVDGLRLAVIVGASLAVIASVVVFRYLPHALIHAGAERGDAQPATAAEP